MEKKRKALGKGIGALLPATDTSSIMDSKKTYLLCPIERIHPNPYQPRDVFDDAKLKELVDSVREKGIIQPLIVRKNGANEYELIAGERRWRAAQKVGLKEIPVVIKDVSDRESLEIAIIENIQRADLNPVEEARGYKRLMEEFSYTQEEMATQVGKERATISNHLRILKLPKQVLSNISDGLLSMGHAKALLSIMDEKNLLAASKTIIDKGLSVREAEALARKEPQTIKKKKDSGKKDPDLAKLDERLTSHFGTKARVTKQGSKGRLEIEFYSMDELDRLIEIIGL
ncbi:MAG: ParB/RepB/Spo0J family partition protein [bacterium]|nr:ParB/RepB/Spo0J family partition protein [bacterium]